MHLVPIIATVFLCGSNDEMLLRRSDGQVIADTSKGAAEFLQPIRDGNYRSAENCSFTLETAGGVRSLSWDGRVQAFWPAE